MNKVLVAIWETVQVAVIALIVVVGVRQFLIQPFFVEGSSMTPNFRDGDYLIIDELSYRFRQPERGEVVVFKFPKMPGTYFIKRIIGLPGEVVMLKDSQITIINDDHPEGIDLEESYIEMETPGDSETVLGEGEYFVMGDNRSMSYDSRNWGVLSEDDIIGLARFRLWPIKTLSAFSAPAYQ